jgi:hypothetical protein
LVSETGRTWLTGLGGLTGDTDLTGGEDLAGHEGLGGDLGFTADWSLIGENGLTEVTGAEVEKLRGVLAGGGGEVRLGRARLF